MTEQLSLFQTHGNPQVSEPPVARAIDPQTSHEAAAGVDLGKLQTLALQQLESSDEPLTAAEVGMRCMRAHGGMAESYRKRLGELVRKGVARECEPRECSISHKQATTYEVK